MILTFPPSCSSLKTQQPRVTLVRIFAASSVKSLPHTSQELQERKGVRSEFPVLCSSIHGSPLPTPSLSLPSFWLLWALPWMTSNWSILPFASFSALCISHTWVLWKHEPPQIYPRLLSFLVLPPLVTKGLLPLFASGHLLSVPCSLTEQHTWYQVFQY